jgi:hypothetical protein
MPSAGSSRRTSWERTDLLNGNDTVIETTAGHVRARLVRFRNGAVFEHWHSSRDGVGHGMGRIEREQLSDPVPLLVDLLVRDVVPSDRKPSRSDSLVADRCRFTNPILDREGVGSPTL